MSEAEDLIARARAKLDEAARVERVTDAWSGDPGADLRRIDERAQQAHGLRLEASVLSNQALIADRAEGPETVPCKACGGSGKADPFAATYRNIFACDGCKGAGVLRL